jgi:hypothetical protein
MVAHLLLIYEKVSPTLYKQEILPTLRASVHNQFGYHAGQEKAVQAQSHSKADPIVSIFQRFQCIPIEVYGAIKILFIKCLHWDFVSSMVFDPIVLTMEMEITLDRPARESSFRILSR